jgi:hypothetical protein
MTLLGLLASLGGGLLMGLGFWGVGILVSLPFILLLYLFDTFFEISSPICVYLFLSA